MLQGLIGNRVFSPMRDIVQLFPMVIGKHAILRLLRHQFPPALRKFAESANIHPDDLAAAELAFAAFVKDTVHYAVDDLPTLWTRSGMERLKPPVLLALLAVIGEVTMGIFYQTARASIRQGQSVQGVQNLESLADMSAEAMKSSLPSDRMKRVLEAEKAAIPDLIEHTPSENNT